VSGNDYHSFNSALCNSLVYSAFYCLTSENKNTTRNRKKDFWHPIFSARRPPNKNKIFLGHNPNFLPMAYSYDPNILDFSELRENLLEDKPNNYLYSLEKSESC
tara:strand:+ start:103 stop:414 length:312 start_codon:yes stop_codon:yes gene_type:complete